METGATSFRREKYVPDGGPDGGDGGNGGNIIFVVDKDQNTLRNFRWNKLYKAEDGGNGAGSNCTKLKENQLEVGKADNISRGIDKLWKKVRKTVAGPVWLVNTPKFISPLSKANPDGRSVQRFQPISVDRKSVV